MGRLIFRMRQKTLLVKALFSDELCDIETDSDSENEMSEEEQHIDHHALAVQFCLQKETLASEENFQEGMKEFIETIVTIANGKHLTEKHEINATLEPGIENGMCSLLLYNRIIAVIFRRLITSSYYTIFAF